MKNKIDLQNIDLTINYEGYLWWSNKKKPDVLQENLLASLPAESDNPFIIEGNLYDEKNKLSCLIKFIDGKYFVYRFNLKELDKTEFIKKEYLPNRFPKEIEKLCFREYWKPEKDEFCEDMDVLKPAMTVFVGFKKQEEKK